MYLLDSSVFIELTTEGKRSEIALSFIGDEEVAISALTVYEILFGIDNIDEKVDKLLNEIVVVNYDKASAEISAKMDKELTKQGNKLGFIDMLIASVAMSNKLTLITFDKDFSRIKGLDVKVLSFTRP